MARRSLGGADAAVVDAAVVAGDVAGAVAAAVAAAAGLGDVAASAKRDARSIPMCKKSLGQPRTMARASLC